MSSLNDQEIAKIHNEEEPILAAMQLAMSSALPMVLKTAIELDLFEIIEKSDPTPVSASQISSQLPTQNPDAPLVLDRILRFLASYSVLKCTISVNDEGGKSQRLYSLAPVAKCFTRNEDGVSIAHFLLFLQSKHIMDCWYHLKDAVLEGGASFRKAHGVQVFDYIKENTIPSFNEAMYDNTVILMKKILETYNGLEGLKEVIDLGGGFGANLGMIVSKYPHIKGINFDLPAVVKDAPTIPGVHHVGGDMFTNYLPKAEAIFLKTVLHNWDDDKCLKILQNCYEALPKSGKVIVVEKILPEFPESDTISRNVFHFDMCMLISLPKAKERTKKEFEALATMAGFESIKFVCNTCGYWVIEFYK